MSVELLQRIVAEPENDSLRLSYADAIEDQHPEWAKFIRLQIARDIQERKTGRHSDRYLPDEERKLLEKHRKSWYPELSKCKVSDALFARGFLDFIQLNHKSFEHGEKLLELYPTIRKVRMLSVKNWLPQMLQAEWIGRIPELDLSNSKLGTQTIKQLADCPYLDRIETLWLERNEMRPSSLTALAHSPNLSSLKHLTLSGEYAFSEKGLEQAGAGSLWTHLESLKLLDMHWGDEHFQAFVSQLGTPNWKRLEITANGLTEAGVRALIKADFFHGVEYLQLASVYATPPQITPLLAELGFRCIEMDDMTSIGEYVRESSLAKTINTDQATSKKRATKVSQKTSKKKPTTKKVSSKKTTKKKAASKLAVPATSNTEKAFWEALWEDWNDDLPFLVYADWLEEQERMFEAEYIRVSIEYEIQRRAKNLRDGAVLDGPMYRRMEELREEIRFPWQNVFKKAGSVNHHKGIASWASFSADRFMKNGDFVLDNSPIRHVCITRARFNKDELLECPALKKVRYLEFYNSQLGSDVTQVLTSPHLENIIQLSLGRNHLRQRDLAERLAAANLPKLKKLLLQECGISDKTLDVLAEWPILKQLDELILFYNSFTLEGLKRFLDSKYVQETMLIYPGSAEINLSKSCTVAELREKLSA